MSNIEMLHKLSEEIKSTSGKNDKESILRREKNNEEFKTFLKYVFDDGLVFGIQEKKLKKFIDKPKESTNNFDSLFDVFEYLSENNTGKDSDVQVVVNYINKQDEQYKQFLIDSICKRLRIGIDKKSINKGFGENLIRDFSPMLAHPFEKYEDKVKGKTVYVTEKLDGNRSTFIVKDGKVEGYSRSGKRLEGYEHIESELKQLPDNVYDGEILIKNAEQYKDREVMQMTQSISGSKGDKSQLELHLYDVIDIEGFDNGKSKYTYSKRREILDNLDTSNFQHVHVLPVLYKGKDLDYIFELLSQLESEGKEGLMLNFGTGIYTTGKRSSSILKMKTFKSYEDRCLDIFEGEGKYKGKLGGIVVNYKGYKLFCGSGFTDEQREYYWNNPDEIIGRIVEVKYFRESSDKEGNLSVSFPVFQVVRNDKNEPSYN